MDIVGEVAWFAPDSGPHGSMVAAETSVFDASGDVAPGNSDEQKRAERAMIAALSADLGGALTPRSILLPSGNRLAVDGMSDDPLIYCEAWAHQGPLKSTQRAKIAKDLLKLTFLASVAPTPPRLILLFPTRRRVHHSAVARGSLT